MNEYNDIINLPHYVSKKHPQMSKEARSAQFAPFAALSGYEDAIKETAKLTDNKIELSDEMINIINDKLLFIEKNIQDKPLITITYFVPDKRKNGGEYISVTNSIKQIDLINNIIILTNKKKICINDIIGISGI